MQNVNMKRGEVIIFSAGRYSDYGYVGEVIIIKDFSLKEQVQAYRKITNPDKKSYNDEMYGFVGWLISRELALPLDSRTVHLGDYNNFAEEFMQEDLC